MNDKDSAQRLHQSTKHGTAPSHPQRLARYRRMDPGSRPRPFKSYRGLEKIRLPRVLVESSLPATAVLSGERGSGRSLDAALLATLLFLGAGVTRVAGPPAARTYFRTAMSAGNLHPVEIYLVAGEVGGLAAGVYHFDPLGVSLTRLRDGDHRRSIDADGAAALVLTGIPWRTAWKYGERGWRHLYWDGGTILANLTAAADAHGLDHRTLVGFDDAAVRALLGVDGMAEMPLAVVLLGDSPSRPPPSPPLPPLSAEVAPVASHPVRLPLLEEAQWGSELSAGEVEAWRAAGATVARNAPTRVSAPGDGGEPIEKVILRRGSTREMAHRVVPLQNLAWAMAAATTATGMDVAPDGTLLRHFVNVHAVQDLEPGPFRYTDGGLDRMGADPALRLSSASLCLGQALGGDAAYTAFHCAELGGIIGALGSRGYRAAQLESGIVSGRLALCAFALGLGATGLTFFDDAVSQFFRTTAQPMLVTAVGVPVSGSAPYGSPGRPAQIRR